MMMIARRRDKAALDFRDDCRRRQRNLIRVISVRLLPQRNTIPWLFLVQATESPRFIATGTAGGRSAIDYTLAGPSAMAATALEQNSELGNANTYEASGDFGRPVGA